MATPGALRVVEWNLAYFRKLWRSNLFNSFLQPMMYLIGLGLGIGSLVNRNTASDDSLGGLPYAQFVAPGLLAAGAMTIGYIESAWPVLGGFKWQRNYLAQAATPLRPRDIVFGHMVWITLRMAMAGAAVAAAMMCFPSVRSLQLIPGVAFATISGLSFAMVVFAFATYQEREVGFVSLQRFVVIPLTLFGGVFFPLGQLPEWVRAIIQVTPLWHGTALCRGLVQHTLGFTDAVGHLAYLVAWILVGTVVGIRQFTRRLVA